ncbi:hypothetical protein KSS87_016698 [Heliosperma pusillum]|nr:hypothetical protein KSS87_016698 [Heliosperma pusillum]
MPLCTYKCAISQMFFIAQVCFKIITVNSRRRKQFFKNTPPDPIIRNIERAYRMQTNSTSKGRIKHPIENVTHC